MSGRQRNLAAVAALGAGLFVVVFFVFLNHHSMRCCVHHAPPTVLVARTAIPKGTPGSVIRKKALYWAATVRLNQIERGAFVDPSAFVGKVALRRISRGEQLTAADFAAAPH
jgi:flagella basal body P-ring formation protein FlgA